MTHHSSIATFVKLLDAKEAYRKHGQDFKQCTVSGIVADWFYTLQ